MTVTREQVRQKIVAEVKTVVEAQDLRFQAPGLPPVDVSNNKNLYVRLEIIYLDGTAVGLGVNVKDRLYGTILTEVNYKEGAHQDLVKANTFLDAMQVAISNQDIMYPVRTYSSRQHSPQEGYQSGWIREALITPFWYDM